MTKLPPGYKPPGSPPPKAKPSLFELPPPFDEEAEMGVLGSIMLLPDVSDDVMGICGPEDFHDDARAVAFRHLLQMHNSGRRIDPTLLVDKLNSAGEYEKVGGAAFIGKILHAVPNAAHAVFYAEIVRDKAILRRIIERATDILRRAYGPVPDVSTLLSETETLVSSIANSQATEARLIGDVAIDAVKAIVESLKAESKPGAMTGLVSLDDTTGRIMPGEMAVIAARPGGGKTAIGMQIAEHNAERSRSVLFVSLEMKDLELVNRALCQRAAIDSRTLRGGALTDDHLLRLRSASATLDGTPLRVWAPPRRANTAQIRSVGRRVKARHGLELIIVDYIGRVVPMPEHRSLRRHEQIGKVTEALKDIAKELDVPLIALAQLNRDAENQRPQLSNLKESGDIEQDADMVIFLYHPDTEENARRSPYDAHDAELIVEKHRHGARGTVPMFWTPWETRFSDSKEWNG